MQWLKIKFGMFGGEKKIKSDDGVFTVFTRIIKRILHTFKEMSMGFLCLYADDTARHVTGVVAV